MIEKTVHKMTDLQAFISKYCPKIADVACYHCAFYSSAFGCCHPCRPSAMPVKPIVDKDLMEELANA